MQFWYLQSSSNLGPATDYYKKLALDCSAQQVAVDLFMLNGQYGDIATVCESGYLCLQFSFFFIFAAAKTVDNMSLSLTIKKDISIVKTTCKGLVVFFIK